MLASPVLLAVTLVALGADKDAFGRALRERVPANTPVLVLYASPDTRGRITRQAAQLAWRLRETPYVTLVSVDLAGVPFLVRGYARGKVRDAWREGLAGCEKEFAAHGEPLPPTARSHLVFVADGEGKSHRRAGLQRGFKEVLGVVLDAHGDEVARGPFLRDLPRLEAALREAVRAPGGG